MGSNIRYSRLLYRIIPKGNVRKGTYLSVKYLEKFQFSFCTFQILEEEFPISEEGSTEELATGLYKLISMMKET